MAHFCLPAKQQQQQPQQAEQAQLLTLQQELAQECEARSRLQQQLAAREAVIGQLARRRDDATASRLASYQSAWQQGERRCAHAVEGLASQRQQYARLAASLATTVHELEEGDEAPCTCCGGSRPAAAAIAVFQAAAQAAHLHSQAAGWQAEACDLQLEVTHCRQTLEEAGAEVAYLERCIDRLGEEARDWERRAQAAEAALVRERAQATLLRQQAAKQAAAHTAGAAWSHDSSSNLLAVKGLGEEAPASAEEAAGHEAFTIAAWRAPPGTKHAMDQKEGGKAELPPVAVLPHHARSHSNVSC